MAPTNFRSIVFLKVFSLYSRVAIMLMKRWCFSRRRIASQKVRVNAHGFKKIGVMFSRFAAIMICIAHFSWILQYSGSLPKAVKPFSGTMTKIKNHTDREVARQRDGYLFELRRG